MKNERAIKAVVDAILKEELHYYRQTGGFAYVAQYEDGELQIVYNALSARHSRPGMKFEIVASAKWEDCLGNPRWTIYDGEGEAVAAIATEIDGTADTDVYYF